jgi:uncharacterized protein (TIGR00369 family)
LPCIGWHVTIGNMPSAELLNMIRDNLGSTVPFALHVGVQLHAVDDGSAHASLPEHPSTLNHIATAHAGAMFTLAETASGAAVAGAFAEQIFEVRPVVRSANITYLKVGRGELAANAKSRQDADSLRSTLNTEGRVDFTVDVVITNADGNEIAKFEAEWVVSKTKKP